MLIFTAPGLQIQASRAGGGDVYEVNKEGTVDVVRHIGYYHKDGGEIAYLGHSHYLTETLSSCMHDVGGFYIPLQSVRFFQAKKRLYGNTKLHYH